MIKLRKFIYLTLLINISFLLVSCQYEKIATAKLQSKSGSQVKGEIKFLQNRNGKVKMLGKIQGLPSASHAIHIHEKGDCSSEDGKSAGGHWNPTSKQHGKWGHNNFHSGDIGNLRTNSKGEATIKHTSKIWQLGKEDDTTNIIGKAIIIHAGVDDFTSQPTGAAGKRIACGVISL